MKKVLIALLALFTIVSCDKSDDDVKSGYVPNKYRVKQIKGNTEMWGDFTLNVKYNTLSQLDESYCLNAAGDTISMFYAVKENNLITINLIDYLKDQETGKYTNKSRTRYKVATKTVNNKIQEQTINTYAPKAVRAEDDEKVDNYINVTFEKHIYEYSDATGKMINHRNMIWKYDQRPDYGYYYNTQYESFVYKNKLNYSGNVIGNVEFYIADGKDENSTNYRLIETNQFHYSGDLLASIAGGSLTRTISYSGNKTTVQIGDVTKTYELDSNGNVVKISDNAGHSVTITYEEGHGNFSTIVPLFETLLGVPSIK